MILFLAGYLTATAVATAIVLLDGYLDGRKKS
jgi:hypothetical protein